MTNDTTPPEDKSEVIQKTIHAYKVEFPPFASENVKVWLAQVELRLEMGGVKSERNKFNHLASSLIPDVAAKIQDILFDPPEVDPFEKLKKRLIKEYAPSDSEEIDRLLQGCQLGDQKPTSLLREMQALAKSRISEDILRDRFLKRLPESLRMVVAGSRVTDLQLMAEMADTALEYAGTSRVTSVSSVSVSQPTSAPPTNETSVLVAQVAVLAKTVDKFVNEARQSRPRGRQPYRDSNYSRSRARSRSQTPKNREFCWYHNIYGDRALKCKEGCTWKKSAAGKSENSSGPTK